MSEVAGAEEAIGTEFPVALPLEEERAKVCAEVFRWHWRGYAVQAADLPQMREVRIKTRFPRQHREMRASLGPTQRMHGARVNFAGQREAQLVVGPRCHRVRDFAHTRHPSSSYALYCRTPWLPPGVQGELSGATFALRSDGASSALPRCVHAYAYWNLLLLRQEHLLNPQTGTFDPVHLEELAVEAVRLSGRAERGMHYALEGPSFRIEPWYFPTGDWLALQTRTRQRRLMRYEKLS
jgi:hypothetical protein